MGNAVSHWAAAPDLDAPGALFAVALPAGEYEIVDWGGTQDNVTLFSVDALATAFGIAAS
jgi:hypothetical protein